MSTGEPPTAQSAGLLASAALAAPLDRVGGSQSFLPALPATASSLPGARSRATCGRCQGCTRWLSEA
eukprot:11193236-Lingulodinium_polyedra.AAC.1